MLLTTRKVKLIEKKAFIVVIFEPDYKNFIIYIAAFNISFDIGDKVYPLKKSQIAHIKADKTSIEVSNKFSNFANIFLLKLIGELSKYMGINNYVIKLVND